MHRLGSVCLTTLLASLALAPKCSEEPLPIGSDGAGQAGASSGGASSGGADASGGHAAGSKNSGGANSGGADSGTGNASAGGASSGGGSTSGGASDGLCPKSACGPQLGLANMLCDDGVTVSGPTGRCLAHADGSCGWEVLHCPPPGSGGAPSDGGGGAGGESACDAFVQSVQSLFADHRACNTDADCHTVHLSCLPGGRCTGTQYANLSLQQSDVDPLQSQLNACVNGDPNTPCNECLIPDYLPACIEGSCAPQQ